jgi:hypothetical protein
LIGRAIEPPGLLTIICCVEHEHIRTLARNDYPSVPSLRHNLKRSIAPAFPQSEGPA